MFGWFRCAPVPVPASPPQEPPSASPLTEAAPADLPKPLAAAARRRDIAIGKRKVNADVAIGMRAAGVPVARIAEVMESSPQEIFSEIAAIPGGKAILASYRDRLRLTKLHRAHRVEGRLWSRFETEVDQGTAKDVDAIARALHASEKIQASAAGDTQKVEVTGSGQPAVDLKILIQNILEERGVAST